MPRVLWLKADCGCRVYANVEDQIKKPGANVPTSYEIEIDYNCDDHQDKDDSYDSY